MCPENREKIRIFKSKQFEKISEHLQSRLHKLEQLLEKKEYSKGLHLEKLWLKQARNHFYRPI